MPTARLIPVGPLAMLGLAVALAFGPVACTPTASEPASAPQPEESVTPAPSEQQTSSVSGGAMNAGEELSAKAIWRNELASKAYQEWEAAGGEKPAPATGPHGATVKVYFNDEIASGLSSPMLEWPVGSILVKDIFGGGGELQNVAYMIKTGNGWFYAEYGPDGAVVVEGLEIASCAECHAQGVDSVRTLKPLGQ